MPLWCYWWTDSNVRLVDSCIFFHETGHRLLQMVPCIAQIRCTRPIILAKNNLSVEGTKGGKDSSSLHILLFLLIRKKPFVVIRGA